MSEQVLPPLLGSLSRGFLYVCERCSNPRLLLVRIRGIYHCADCWRAAGSLFPIACEAAEAFAVEQATRKRMLQRGGSDRYRARAGKT